MDDQIKAFGYKKISEKSDVGGAHMHVQVERFVIFYWQVLILYRFHECDMIDFNFHVDENSKHDYDSITYNLTWFYFTAGVQGNWKGQSMCKHVFARDPN